ncbi:MAG: hypothetical protein COZ34_00390 [Candidatus Pacebacteria bacterium CG_4_10_14_3_um_filter_34_15]|nr:membrane protein insertion efficiency factor YidD [Candidatus Pacearchaeota archaeon]NCQ65658.1 membrane protein insertion efficiency factor YidD [Candidatus Paceibacterota bacterium]PIQ80673.1 MAG: hypothetical protein COV78_04270 [Candidatus Pacebacteria bacterium CG11_big_fil_rev_8_21_14_0_20_34_55]PIX81985.1 MAG: hypothetical protein COZ34_00390 [Candidatus Pacebacteria bacterium CG_4_10_14_3_um_filter_34_15]PJC43591.1 MAG: hypothetical protein CO039_03320 [Candidatus Pacebacteria bacter
MKLQYKILLATYQFFRTVRYNLLRSAFGIVVHCKHSPTCGTYAFKQIKEKGILIGGIKGLKRILSCW